MPSFSSSALAAALRAGEAPSIAAPVAPPTVELTSYETYQRSVLGRSQDDILGERARAVSFVAHTEMSGALR